MRLAKFLDTSAKLYILSVYHLRPKSEFFFSFLSRQQWLLRRRMIQLIESLAISHGKIRLRSERFQCRTFPLRASDREGELRLIEACNPRIISIQ